MTQKHDRFYFRNLPLRAACVLSLAFAPHAVKNDEARLAAAEPENLPVILLTGFEPFGREKPPNPSWEGIKALDGRRWKDYRLCLQMLAGVVGLAARRA